jgi:hypothetical protein
MRGLRFTAERLKAAGHVVVEWRGEFRVNTTEELIGGFWTADGGAACKSSSNATFRRGMYGNSLTHQLRKT